MSHDRFLQKTMFWVHNQIMVLQLLNSYFCENVFCTFPTTYIKLMGGWFPVLLRSPFLYMGITLVNLQSSGTPSDSRDLKTSVWWKPPAYWPHATPTAGIHLDSGTCLDITSTVFARTSGAQNILSNEYHSLALVLHYYYFLIETK